MRWWIFDVINNSILEGMPTSLWYECLMVREKILNTMNITPTVVFTTFTFENGIKKIHIRTSGIDINNIALLFVLWMGVFRVIESVGFLVAGCTRDANAPRETSQLTRLV